MNLPFVLRTLSVLLLIVSAFMAISIPVAILSGEPWTIPAFLVPIAASILLFGVMTAATRRDPRRALPVQATYILVVLSWVLSSVLATVPFILTGSIPRFIDAFFEVMSGFTTTGASILSDVEALPRSILFWRSMTHWLGGMGIVVLTVALFPLLGIGGLRLMDAESPGPTVDKVTPRISSTAKILWLLYLALTVLQIILLLLGGMSLFDAATHAFGTMATGGFSTRNASVGHFRSGYIDWVITVFMVLAGMNFTLYYRLLRGQWRSVARDTELRAYSGVFLLSTLAVAASLLRAGTVTGFWRSLRFAGFQTASFLTTTGFSTADFARWPGFAQIVLFVLMFIGGCAGSTGGGIKVVRLVTIFKHSLTEMKYMIAPHGVYAVRVGGQVVRKNAIYGVYAFVFLYLLTLFSTILVVASSGADVLTSVTASLATLGNIGPGFAAVGPTANYGHFPGYVKLYLGFAMLAGRLEIYTVLILGTRTFWRR